ncbi:MAG: TldD/PmbA family protein, partial [Verrucomicrobiales bacterium]|nr:TldD/PmbA family protein [Verrucomicrobiales bacterium]
EHLSEWGAAEEAALAVEQAREKMAAPSVVAGKKDLVIAPSNLWLTIHETVGHPTELDRALGYEANFAGTSFCTPDKLDSLQYGSAIVNIFADRTAATGLATVAWDDDGVETAGKEFPIIKEGVFRNFQMALGQAALIGREGGSNGCAYSDSFDAFPIQRMPNISLQPGSDDTVTAESLIADVEDGIYIDGNGSWSIDQQRYNFQFTGQVFHRIRNGKLDGMFRDVAYQGNSVDFWNACDGLGGKSSYELGGAFNCGKGQPQQVAPVSHGAVPARFRQINVLNTAQESGKGIAAAVQGGPVKSCDCSGSGEWA